MAGPVLLTSSAANRIRSSVSAISMPSKPFGIVGSGGGKSQIPIPMPLDLSIRQVTENGVTAPHLCVSLMGLQFRVGDSEMGLGDGLGGIDVRNPQLPQALYDAWDNGDNYWDLGYIGQGGITTNQEILLYVLTRLENSGVSTRPLVNKAFWGMVVGTDWASAVSKVPALSSTQNARHDVTCHLLCIQIGGMAIVQGKPFTFQSWHGGVSIPAFEDVDVVTNSRYDVNNHQLQKKTRRALIAWGGLETDWTMVEGGQAELYP